MITENITKIKDSIEKCKLKYGVSYDIALMAVSKTYPVQSVIEAMDAGQVLFGENRVLEAYDKFTDSSIVKRDFNLHIIGHLQRNKAKEAVKIASMIQSIDKIETLLEIEKQCLKIDKNIDFLVEINTSGEEQKCGLKPDNVYNFIEEIEKNNFLKCNLRGLMTVGPLTDDSRKVKESFNMLRKFFDKIKSDLNKNDFDVLSMGMSSDYEAAIGEGSNLLRIGSAIFGNREYK